MSLEWIAQNIRYDTIELGHVLFERGKPLHTLDIVFARPLAHFFHYHHVPQPFSLHQEIDDTKGAITQANLSLKELKPFATEKGIVLTGKKLTKKRTNEPLDTYTESKALQAKAYFRLGSAQIAMQEYDDAVKTFEHSVDSTKEAGMLVDAAVMRKINEAKRGRKEKKERQRKKFKFMFSVKNEGESKDTGVDDWWTYFSWYYFD